MTKLKSLFQACSWARGRWQVLLHEESGAEATPCRAEAPGARGCEGAEDSGDEAGAVDAGRWSAKTICGCCCVPQWKAADLDWLQISCALLSSEVGKQQARAKVEERGKALLPGAESGATGAEEGSEQSCRHWGSFSAGCRRSGRVASSCRPTCGFKIVASLGGPLRSFCRAPGVLGSTVCLGSQRSCERRKRSRRCLRLRKTPD